MFYTFKKNITYISLLLLLFTAGFLRFYNLNWDQGNLFHPDERNIANAVVKIHFFNQLNPEFFAYGGFSMYGIRAAGTLLDAITKTQVWTTDWAHINLIGRFFSAFFSTITIFPLFLLAQKIGNKVIALFSCTLYAFCVSSVQMAHFGTTESFFTLTGVVICLASLYLYENPRLKLYLLIGILGGIATATKTTEIGLLIFPFTAHLLSVIKYRRTHLFTKNVFFILLLVVGLLTFTLFSPYTFLDWNAFMASMLYETGVALGTLPVVYTDQFIHTIPYLFQIENFFWQMGPITVFSVIGIPFILFYGIKQKNPKLLIFLSFPLIYFLYAGTWYAKFIRYMVPLLPFLIISASYVLFVLYKKHKLLGQCFMSISVLGTILWAASFFSIYTKTQTRITASTWIYQNIPEGARLLEEHWNDRLPIAIASYNPNQYTIEQLNIYDHDNQQKLHYYAQKLSEGDVIVLSTRRLHGTLIHLPKQYPITSKYYHLLFAGELGYQKVAEFASYPSLLGFTINDDASEETFQVFDHPKVIVFKNEEHFSKETIENILQ